MDYIVEVRDIFKGLVLFRESYSDANTAYSTKRKLEDEYYADPAAVDHISVDLVEPR